jgi:ATP-dependent RNA helicase DeaD
MKIVQQRFSKKTILLSNTTDVGLAKTGTEKQPLWIPILQLIDTNATAVQAVILVPTRELGHQFLEI